MATTENLYTGDGTTVLFSFTFPYIDTADIKVSLDGVDTTAYSLANATTIEFAAPPAGGSSIRIYRQTALGSLDATFYPGSSVRAQDLNTNFTQLLYVTQEIANYSVQTDGSRSMEGDLDMGNYQITNLAAPTTNDNAVNKLYVDSRLGSLSVPGFTRWSLTAVGGETTLSGAGTTGGTLGYSPSREQVYLNGAQLQRDADYTANNGTSIVLNVALTAGDVVEVICVNNLNTGTTAQAQDVYWNQSGTGAITRTVESKLIESISAFDFMTEDEVSSVTTGTVNGVESFLDVTNALQAAINAAAGKQLILPPGIYHISSTLTVPRKSWLQGTGTSALFPNFSTDWIGNRVPSWGYRATTIQYLDGHGTIFDTANDCRFDGLVIRSYLSRTPTDTDLVFDGGSHFKFTNCVVQRMEGLLPSDAGLTTGACLIDSCQFTACEYVVYGIFLDAKVLNSTFTSFTSTPFTITSGGGLNSFIGNRFDFCQGPAIRFLTNSRNNRVIGNNFDSHAKVALQFDQTNNKNIIANNHFWRCGRNETGDETAAFIKLFASSNQYFVGNLFVRGGPDIGSAWNGPEYVIGLESCTNKNYFVGNTIDKSSCYNKLPIKDKLGDSAECIDIDSIFIGDDSGGDIGGTALELGKFMTKPTVCYITENKTVTGYASAFNKLILTGASSGLTITNSGGVLAIGDSSQINNITYGGRLYSVIDGLQHADGIPDGFRSQGNWGVGRKIYYISPQSNDSLGIYKSAAGSPDTWAKFARNDVRDLNEYEEGTFVPTIEGSTSAGTGTYSAQIGRYVKIGKQVTVWIKLVWSAHTGTGNGEIANLPFSIPAISGGQHPFAAIVGYETNYNVPANTVLSAYVVPNSNNIRLAQIGVGTQSGASSVTLDTAAGVTISATYETA